MTKPAGSEGEDPVQASFEFAGPPKRFSDIDRGSANTAAISFLENADAWPFPVACLIGPPRSGKTTLAMVWATEIGGFYHTPETLEENRGSAERAATAIALDPGDQGLPENTLLSLINQASERGNRLLLTGAVPPMVWPVENRDLASRLASLPVAEIHPPDAEMATARLYSLLRRHFATPPMDVVRYLSPRLKRSYADIESCAKRLAGRVGSGQALTVALAGTVVNEMYGTEEESDG
ncbi:MAG: hypothetical protein AAGI03_10895 [Pseudomonadota bacterium]